MKDYGKRDVLGILIDAVDKEAAVDRVLYFARHRRPCSVTALAVHGIVEGGRDERLAAALNDFDVVLPDGQPVRWALNHLYGLDLPDKVPGPTIVDELLARASADGYSVHFHGGTPETLDLIGRELQRRYGTDLRFTLSASFFRKIGPEELDTLVTSINATGARMCFVGLGCPRQERFVATIAPRLDMPAMAVGAAFDYLAGNLKRAPVRLQRLGLEWAYRLAQEPKRLARRYAVTNSSFMLGVSRQFIDQQLVSRRARSEPEPFAVDGLLPASWALVDA